MADCIEREYTLDAIKKYFPRSYRSLNIFRDIKELPAADVVEVRHGQWIVTDVDWGYSDAARKNFVSHKYTCSVCGYETGDQGEKFVCCPMCMSRMDKEDEHEAG